ncbi:1670_t:CDS:2, partial [Racocetra fulgida]
MVKPRVAIIGAGLAALKQCLDDDLDPICFEQTSYVGGLWNFVEVDDENKDPHPSAYKSLIINTSKETVFKYVTSVNKDQTSEHEEIFDFVMVCNGHHRKHRWPKYKGMDEFKGPHPPSLEPTTPVFSSHPTVKSDFFERLSTGTIIIKKNILELMPDETKSIKFVDGFIVENIDTVIYATGYHIDFPFLDREIVNGGPEIEQEFEDEYKENLAWMYKMMFPPNYRNIAFIARYATSLIKGFINPLPSPQEMNIAIRNYQEKIRKQYYSSARHTIQVDFLEYLDELSQEL